MLEMAELLPVMKSGELIPCCALLPCMAFALPVTLPLSQLMSSLTFILPILSPIPLGEGLVSCFVWLRLLSGVKPCQNEVPVSPILW